MSLQQPIPEDILKIEIIAKHMSLDDIYSLCSKQIGLQLLPKSCNQAVFWRKIGEKKFPTLTKLIKPYLNSSVGKFYHDVAKFILQFILELDHKTDINFRDINFPPIFAIYWKEIQLFSKETIDFLIKHPYLDHVWIGVVEEKHLFIEFHLERDGMEFFAYDDTLLLSGDDIYKIIIPLIIGSKIRS